MAIRARRRKRGFGDGEDDTGGVGRLLANPDLGYVRGALTLVSEGGGLTTKKMRAVSGVRRRICWGGGEGKARERNRLSVSGGGSGGKGRERPPASSAGVGLVGESEGG